MNTAETETKTINPAASAGFLSRVTFWWMRNIILLGYKRPLKETEIPDCLDEHQSTRINSLFKILWEDEKSRENSRILRLFWRAYGARTVFYGTTYVIVETLARCTLPQLLGMMLKYFSPDSRVSLHDACLFALGILFCFIIPVLVYHPFHLWNVQTAMRLRTGAYALIYEKMMRFTKSAQVDKLNESIHLLMLEVKTFESAANDYHKILTGPVQAVLFGYFIHQELGLFGLLGIVIMLSFLLVQCALMKKEVVLRSKAAGTTKPRMKFMQEIIENIEMIKMHTWESFYNNLIKKIRQKEFNAIQKGQYVQACLWSLMIYRLCFFLSISCCVVTGKILTIRNAFVSFAYFIYLNDTLLKNWIQAIVNCFEAYKSAKQIEEFLLMNEKKPAPIDSSSGWRSAASLTRRFHDPNAKINKILLQRVSADWTTSNGLIIPGIRSAEILFRKGLCVIIGPRNAGKTTLLQVILGELEIDGGFVYVDGTISYASQKPWIFEGTIRQNILFTDDFHQLRYRKVLKICALDHEFEIFPYGDDTVVGKHGYQLNECLKSRISLARAVYRQADIYLFDDPLSAVHDAVGRHIFDLCFNDFLADKVCILTTHQIQYCKEAKHIVLMKDARVEAQGTYNQIKKKNPIILVSLQDSYIETKEKIEMSRYSKEKEEKNELKNVAFKTYRNYFKATCIFMCLALILMIGAQLTLSAFDYFISRWMNWEQSILNYGVNTVFMTSKGTKPSFTSLEFLKHLKDDNRMQYLTWYTGILLVSVIFVVSRSFTFFSMGLRIAKKLHRRLYGAIMAAPVFCFISHSPKEMVQRFGRSIGDVDTTIPKVLMEVLVGFLEFFGILILIVISNYWLLTPIVVFILILYFLLIVYIRVCVNVKHLESHSNTAISTHIHSTLNGLSTIHAFNATETFQDEFNKILDFNSSWFYMVHCTTKAFTLWMDFMCILYAAFVIFSFTFVKQEFETGANLGLAVTQLISLFGLVGLALRGSAELKSVMSSVNRIQEYIDLPAEPETRDADSPGSDWPERGKIEFRHLSLRHRENEEKILQDLNFVIEPQQKVGIVGRKGAGKHFIIQAIFRLASIEGQIEIDGVNTETLALKYLRSKISIVPSKPQLIGETLRNNLDPDNTYTDDGDIWCALSQVELKNKVISLPGGLDCDVSLINFNVSQLQLLCLARGILCRNNILIVEEMNPKSSVQKIVQREFSGWTVISTTNEPHTVMNCDRVLVIEAGRIVENGKPLKLLELKNGVFRLLVEKAGTVPGDLLQSIPRNYASGRKSI